MYICVEPKDVVDAYSTPILQQTSFWSKVKARLGLESRAFEFSVRNSDIYSNVGGYSYTNADLIMFFQHINSEDYIAYIPYGPETEPSKENQGQFLEELSESIRPYLPKHCVALRYDLNWESHWCEAENFDENGDWLGLPKKVFQEIKLNFNTVNHNLRKANTNILPANTVLLDLRPSEEDILMRMKPKTRYNIRLALRKGVDVREAGIESLDIWYNLYAVTALRNVMPAYALQWKAMRIAKAHKCREYDMFGIAPQCDPSHPMYGLYKFKSGFGGDIFHQLGCWDYPVDDSKYNYYSACELSQQGYYR
ncbi:MAG: lipid II:glycine glycyltransferase FemX [Candidatus Cryptobacteroides sp.]